MARKCCHALVTDGVFTPDGTFIAMPPLNDEPFEKLWQKKVFDLLLKRGKSSASLVTQMLGWTHLGLGVHHAVRLHADDHAGRERQSPRHAPLPVGSRAADPRHRARHGDLPRREESPGNASIMACEPNRWAPPAIMPKISMVRDRAMAPGTAALRP